jgi:NADPH:quinone reductase
MRAILVTRQGGPEVMQAQDVADPQPRAGEVVVRVEAAALNFADAMMAMGAYPGGPQPPYVAGLEFAGTIEGTARRVMGFASGGGAFAQRVAADPSMLLDIPAKWSAAEGAAFPVNFLTAYFAYYMADMKPGDRVLIHAVAGGVGTAAVQLGKIFEAEMWGTSSSDEKLARAQALGLQHPINYARSDYEEVIREQTRGKGVNVVFEMLGGEHTVKSARCLAHLGQMVVYGSASGKLPIFDFLTLFSKNASVHNLGLSPMAAEREMMQSAVSDLFQWAAEGRIRPEVGHTLPLEQAADGVRLLLERKNYGKVVLRA